MTSVLHRGRFFQDFEKSQHLNLMREFFSPRVQHGGSNGPGPIPGYGLYKKLLLGKGEPSETGFRDVRF